MAVSVPQEGIDSHHTPVTAHADRQVRHSSIITRILNSRKEGWYGPKRHRAETLCGSRC